jgi:hypothetical protein
MPQTDHTLWNALLTALLALVGFFLRGFHARVDDAHGRVDTVEKHLAQTRETLLRDYADKDHIDQRFDRFEAKLDRLISERNKQ